jgi:hypothetical protein
MENRYQLLGKTHNKAGKVQAIEDTEAPPEERYIVHWIIARNGIGRTSFSDKNEAKKKYRELKKILNREGVF